MQSKTKTFDCVAMKNEIQRKLLERWKGLPEEEIREQIRHDLATSDSPSAKLWRRLTNRSADHAS